MFPVSGSWILAIIILALLLAAAFLLMRRRSRSRAARGPDGMSALQGTSQRNLAYQPEARVVSPLTKKVLPVPVARTGEYPLKPMISVTEGLPDISSSLHALVKKYSLDQFTLATADGLLLASTGGDSAVENAARYAGTGSAVMEPGIPGIVRFAISHKGSDLVGIIRTNQKIPPEIHRMIVRDTQDILTWWI